MSRRGPGGILTSLRALQAARGSILASAKARHCAHFGIRRGAGCSLTSHAAACKSHARSTAETHTKDVSLPKLPPFIPEHDCFICQHAFLDVAFISLQQHRSIDVLARNAFRAKLHSPHSSRLQGSGLLPQRCKAMDSRGRPAMPSVNAAPFRHRFRLHLQSQVLQHVLCPSILLHSPRGASHAFWPLELLAQLQAASRNAVRGLHGAWKGRQASMHRVQVRCLSIKLPAAAASPLGLCVLLELVVPELSAGRCRLWLRKVELPPAEMLCRLPEYRRTA